MIANKKTAVSKIVLFEYLGILCIISFILLYRWNDTTLFGVLGDEFGYWGNAAALAGFDWKSLMSESAYYGMGYSVVIAPLMFIGDYALRYHCAIILNCIFLILSLLCAKYIFSVIAENSTPQEQIAGAMLSVFTINAISQARIAWSETLVSFLMWAVIALMVSISEQVAFWKMALMAITCSYMIMVHQRTLPVALVVVSATMFFLLKNKKYKETLFVLLFFVCLYFLVGYIKNIQISMIYMHSEKSNVNNYDISAGLVSEYYQRVIENIKTILGSFISKLIIAVLCTYYFLAFSLTDILVRVQKKELDKYFWIRLVVLFSALLMIFLTAVQMNGKSRSDLIVYSRYFDFTLGPVILFGIMDSKKRFSKYYKYLPFMVIVFIAAGPNIVDYMADCDSSFNHICSTLPGSLLHFAFGSSMDWAGFKVLLSIYILVLAVTGIALIYSSKRKIRVFCYTFLLCLNCFLANEVSDQVNLWRYAMSFDAMLISDETSDSTLYFLASEIENFDFACTLKEYQFMYPDQSVQAIDLEDISEMSMTDCYLVTSSPIEWDIYPYIKADSYCLYYFD
ncbi:hypothetical protein [Butyrivibrio sp. VCD2006]|uniref:hypothetical protein n=1 Tax=Butyrivibrio sp. VCD2006 TaxID=1280664 RepID=UPI0004033805|nr:hypothetical protein [Butyrivibrio sp. VCD2006]